MRTSSMSRRRTIQGIKLQGLSESESNTGAGVRVCVREFAQQDDVYYSRFLTADWIRGIGVSQKG